MNLKPLSSDGKEALAARMRRKKKTVIDELPPYTYIVSEGVETEPKYFNGFADSVNKKYRDYSTCRRILIKGAGRNTRGLLSFSRRQVSEDFPQATVVWLVYDRDDFSSDDFDNTQYSAEGRLDKRQYRTAWSNESIELWFLLHFQELSANVGRKQYIRLLKQYLPYEKNLPDLYERLKDRMDTAVQRARRQYEAFGNAPPSKRCPATRIFELVEELRSYL